MLYLYALAMIAFRGTEFFVQLKYGLWHSKEEAVGAGFLHAKELYPISEGYHGHQATANRIDDEHVLRAAQFLSGR